MEESLWSCSQCTFLNSSSGLQCTVCGQEKPILNGWRCNNCTYWNKSLLSQTCEVCQNPKPHQQLQQIQQHQQHQQHQPQQSSSSDIIYNPLLIPSKPSQPHIPPPPPPLLPIPPSLPPQPQIPSQIQSQIQSQIHSQMQSQVHSPMQSQNDSFWICPSCTYANNGNLNKDRCDLCDGKRTNFTNDSFVTPTMGGNDNLPHNNDINNDDDYEYDYDDMNDDINNINNKQEEVGPISLPQNPEYEHFESVLNIIVAHAPNHKAAITVLKSLNKITSRVSDQKPKYRVLDTRTHGVQTKLLGFEGSLEYLQLLGYSLDPTQTRLQCLKHPPQHILDKVIILIDLHLKTQREKVRRRRKKQQQELPLKEEEEEEEEEVEELEEKRISDEPEEEQEEDLKLDCGDFTLTQLVGLVTHETWNDDDAIRVLLLCHRCFSDSLELIEAIRKRFFVPAPIEAQKWNEEQIIFWCQSIQRPIQNKCVQILCEWITNYFYVDFCLQPKVLSDLQKFTEQVLECKYESDDGWYDSLATLLTSAIENGQQQLDLNNITDMMGIEKIIKKDNEKDEKEEKKMNNIINDDEIDMKLINNKLQISYNSIDDKQQKSHKKGRLFGGKNKNKNKNKDKDKDNKENRKTYIYEYSAKEIAEQITLVDFEYFNAIHRREFLDKVWKGKKEENNYYPNLQKMIDRFNRIHKFVILSIIYCYKLENRVLIIGHFIDICLHLLELRNFFSLMAVFSALDSISVSKLKYSWLRLDLKYKSLLKNLSTVCDPNPNFKSLRKLMRRSFSSRIPTIPYIGVFLSDLTFVNEGAAKLVEGFINFKRFERFNERCKIVQSFQKISYQQILNLNKNLLSNKIENDINIFNDKLSDSFIKKLVSAAIQADTSNATKSEIAQVKAQMANKNKRRKKKKIINNNNNNDQKNNNNNNNNNNNKLFGRFKK